MARLATFVPPDSSTPRAGEVRGEEVVAFASESLTVLDCLSHENGPAADGPSFALADVTLLAPVPRPRAIFGIGMNYADHVAEIGATPPEAPIVFMKLPSSAARPNAPVSCPGIVKRLDYEGELAVVMGANGRVAGYAVADDLTARDLQKRELQWTRAKGADAFCPYGPWITTAEEVSDPHELWLRTWVNGELRQDSSTSNLIFDIPTLVAFIEEACTLEPGDLILTGTPSGVGMGMDPPRFLGSGDVVRIEIEGSVRSSTRSPDWSCFGHQPPPRPALTPAPQPSLPARTCASLGGSSVSSRGTLTARRCLCCNAAKMLSIARIVCPWFSCMRMIAPGRIPSMTVRSICA
jgi:2-keto-4-pentenoate hydratase/2-oxohepta-3-ene-1,7-dioic acid hydratase in catechol pathway